MGSWPGRPPASTWARTAAWWWRHSTSWSFNTNVFDDAGLDHRLGGLEGVGVLEGVLLERGERHLLGDAVTGVLRGHEVQRRLEEVLARTGGPVVVRQVPTRLPDQDHEVRPHHERVGAPRTVTGRVHERWQVLVVVDHVGLVPRAEQAAAHRVLRRLHHARILRRRHATPRRHHRVRAEDVVVQRLEAVPGELLGLLRGGLLHVQNRCVVELDEGVDEQLPVRLHLRLGPVHLGHLTERVTGQTLTERVERLGERLGRLVVEVDEDEAFPHVTGHRDQTEVLLVEVEELRLLLHEVQAAVEVIAPGVVLARELATRARGLLLRVVVPHQLVAPVAAHVVERTDRAVTVLDDDDAALRPSELLGEVAADAGELLDAPDVQPFLLEDRVDLLLPVLGIVGVLVRNRIGAEAWVVLGPAAFCGLREFGHGVRSL